MARKKEMNVLVSQEDEAQAQQLFEHYHRIAGDLHISSSREQAETTLGEINSTPEATQIALLKLLSREHDTDAADVLNALHELSPNKSVRKEARRSLIRLEGEKVYPGWNPPTSERFVTQATVNAPRFWKGMVTQAREEGELELILGWEQGVDYSDARILVFLLDFWQAGVKDFFTREGTKRRLESDIVERHAKLKDVEFTDCTLAEGRRLIEEVLSVNRWRGTTPHKDYRHYLPLINSLVFETADAGQDRGRTFIKPGLEPEQVAANYVGGWSLGDFGVAYDLLAAGSNLREGLTRDEWIERRRAWEKEAEPGDFEVTLISEREPRQSRLWLPTPFLGSHTGSRREVEIGWSLELKSTPLSGTLQEMPMGTVVNKTTGRHWFWTSYTLVQDEGEWRILSMTDEGAKLQGLSIDELQQELKQLREEVEEIIQEGRPGDSDEERVERLRESIRIVTQAMHLSDALLVKLPLDRSLYAEAANQAESARATERATVYLERMAQRFPERRGDTLRQLGILLDSLKSRYEEEGRKERSERFAKLAEEAMRESIAVDNSPLSYALLAELLIQQGGEERLHEAEELLLKAATLDPSRAEETVIEAGLGNIAMGRNQQEEGLQHFIRAAELSPTYPSIWYIIGHIQYELKRYDEAEESFKQSIETDNELRAYAELSAIYMLQRRTAEGREILEQGLRAHPESAHLRAMLAAMLLDSGEGRRAQAMLEEAERLNPDLQMVKTVRQVMKQYRKR